MIKPSLRILLLAGLGVVTIGGAVVAQVQPMQPVQWDNRRLDQLDRNVRRLERAVTGRNNQGQPVLVEPDPEVVALEGRVGNMDRRLQDMEATGRQVNAELERLGFQLDEANRDNGALRERLDDLQGRLDAMDQAATRAAAERQAAEQAAAEQSTRSPTGSAAGDLAAAKVQITADPAGGRVALERVVDAWPDTVEAREALWRVGDIIRATGDQAGAVQNYAQALQGWPTAGWAGEVTLKLARGLSATQRNPQACAALGEYTRRYQATSTPALRQIAVDTRTRANCS